MSLKARIEAVIYAAEEPVPLAQLATLFAEELLALAAAQAAEAAPELPLTPGEASQPEPQPESQSESQPEPRAETPPEAPAESAAPEPDGQPTLLAEAEAEAKRLRREQDKLARATLRPILDELLADYATPGRGIEIREIAGGYRMATKPEYHDAVRGFVKSLKPVMKLSLQALETLAVVAYKQPVTAPEISEIRGVDSAGVLGSLLARKLISTAGRKQVIGRPILYKTTREFLLRFGLKDLNELPSIEEFEKMAAELTEAETDTEAVPHLTDMTSETSPSVTDRNPAPAPPPLPDEVEEVETPAGPAPDDDLSTSPPLDEPPAEEAPSPDQSPDQTEIRNH